MDYLDLLVTPAKISGAVNTVAREKNRLVGYNTDIEGVRHVFHKYDLDLRGSRITIIGAGGAARAAVIAAAGEAVDKITIVNRSVWRAEKLRDDVEAKLSQDIEVCGLGTPEADRAVLNSEILINATPLGMYPRTDETPVEAKLLEGKTAVVDMVYNPLKTRLLQDAESAGAKAIGGLSMLVAQAVHSFRIWTGTEPDETVALEAALKALGG